MAGCGKVCRDGARNLFIAGTYGLVKALFAVKSNVLRNKPAAGREWLAIQECYRDNAPARWLSTLSMGLCWFSRNATLFTVRSGRKQPEQTTCAGM